MVTTMVRPQSSTKKSVQHHKPSRPVRVALPKRTFHLPPAAIEETEYPLFGVEHETITVPRLSRVIELRAWLAIELQLSGDPWPAVWARAQQLQSKFFHTYSVITLIRPSRALMVGTRVFETLTDFIHIPDADIRHLPRREQNLVRQAFTQGMTDFLHGPPLQLLRPIFSGNGEHVRQATPAETSAIAQERHDALASFCAEQGHRVQFWESMEHAQEAWSEYERRHQAIRNRVMILARLRTRSRSNRENAQAIIRLLIDQELATIAPLAAKLGIPLGKTRLALLADALRAIDPVIVVEEPAWRLPDQGKHARVLRTIVHWDDNGVTLL